MCSLHKVIEAFLSTLWGKTQALQSKLVIVISSKSSVSQALRQCCDSFFSPKNILECKEVAVGCGAASCVMACLMAPNTEIQLCSSNLEEHSAHNEKTEILQWAQRYLQQVRLLASTEETDFSDISTSALNPNAFPSLLLFIFRYLLLNYLSRMRTACPTWVASDKEAVYAFHVKAIRQARSYVSLQPYFSMFWPIFISWGNPSFRTWRKVCEGLDRLKESSLSSSINAETSNVQMVEVPSPEKELVLAATNQTECLTWYADSDMLVAATRSTMAVSSITLPFLHDQSICLTLLDSLATLHPEVLTKTRDTRVLCHWWRILMCTTTEQLELYYNTLLLPILRALQWSHEESVTRSKPSSILTYIRNISVTEMLDKMKRHTLSETRLQVFERLERYRLHRFYKSSEDVRTTCDKRYSRHLLHSKDSLVDNNEERFHVKVGPLKDTERITSSEKVSDHKEQKIGDASDLPEDWETHAHYAYPVKQEPTLCEIEIHTSHTESQSCQSLLRSHSVTPPPSGSYLLHSDKDLLVDPKDSTQTTSQDASSPCSFDEGSPTDTDIGDSIVNSSAEKYDHNDEPCIRKNVHSQTGWEPQDRSTSHPDASTSTLKKDSTDKSMLSASTSLRKRERIVSSKGLKGKPYRNQRMDHGNGPSHPSESISTPRKVCKAHVATSLLETTPKTVCNHTVLSYSFLETDRSEGLSSLVHSAVSKASDAESKKSLELSEDGKQLFPCGASSSPNPLASTAKNELSCDQATPLNSFEETKLKDSLESFIQDEAKGINVLWSHATKTTSTVTSPALSRRSGTTTPMTTPEVCTGTDLCEDTDEISAGEDDNDFTKPSMPGVRFDTVGHRWVASWSSGGRQIQKYFPSKKYGNAKARRMAMRARLDAVTLDETSTKDCVLRSKENSRGLRGRICSTQTKPPVGDIEKQHHRVSNTSFPETKRNNGSHSEETPTDMNGENTQNNASSTTSSSTLFVLIPNEAVLIGVPAIVQQVPILPNDSKDSEGKTVEVVTVPSLSGDSMPMVTSVSQEMIQYAIDAARHASCAFFGTCGGSRSIDHTGTSQVSNYNEPGSSQASHTSDTDSTRSTHASLMALTHVKGAQENGISVNAVPGDDCPKPFHLDCHSQTKSDSFETGENELEKLPKRIRC